MDFKVLLCFSSEDLIPKTAKGRRIHRTEIINPNITAITARPPSSSMFRPYFAWENKVFTDKNIANIKQKINTKYQYKRAKDPCYR